MTVHQTAYEMALIIAASGRPLADWRGIKSDLNRAGVTPDEIDAYLQCALFQRRISESLKYRRSQSDDGYMIKEVPYETDPSIEQLRSNLPVGSVNQVIDRMLEEISILKPKHIAIQTQLGDFDQKTMLRQIELWGDKIIPAIRKELGTPQRQET